MSDAEFKADFPSETIKEGKVRVVVPKLESFKKQPADYAPSKAPVFYNPIMELNRDVSVLVFQAYQRLISKEIFVCDPLTGSGIRGIRYATEIHDVKKVVASDINESSFNLAKSNVHLNGMQDLVTVEHKDANCLLSCYGAPRRRFDIVDIDPFGSPVPYLDSAVRALRNKGLLATTATDLAPLCGVHPKACVRKYGGKPLRTEYCHELAVRLLAGCIATVAAKQDIGVRIVFVHSSDHYIRVYAQIDYGAKKADASVKSLGYVLHCFNCFHRETTRKLSTKFFEKCPECGSKMNWAGPLWLEKIFDPQFCDAIGQGNRRIALRNSAKISRLATLAKKEAGAPTTYYVIDKISNKLHSPVPSMASMLRTLQDKGFEAIPTHFNSRGVRSDAPALVMQKLLQKIIARSNS
ncbi:MAG: tRNA (guanine(10)-N(2))-dimethyltransferase [Candidatus Bathyarchaeota archaeon]|nr:tRNA (guanine(10)-N(2))-dimethyltransferase [Candidatus Bathyarchaeota archaeon]